jgi:hypothetical protein
MKLSILIPCYNEKPTILPIIERCPAVDLPWGLDREIIVIDDGSDDGTGFLTTLTNLNLTDMEACYKAFRSSVLKQITIHENGFGFEPEITAKVARSGARVYEIGISYSGRTYEEGKKIRVWDAVWGLWCILRYNLFSFFPQGKLPA